MVNARGPPLKPKEISYWGKINNADKTIEAIFENIIKNIDGFIIFCAFKK